MRNYKTFEELFDTSKLNILSPANLRYNKKAKKECEPLDIEKVVSTIGYPFETFQASKEYGIPDLFITFNGFVTHAIEISHSYSFDYYWSTNRVATYRRRFINSVKYNQLPFHYLYVIVKNDYSDFCYCNMANIDFTEENYRPSYYKENDGFFNIDKSLLRLNSITPFNEYLKALVKLDVPLFKDKFIADMDFYNKLALPYEKQYENEFKCLNHLTTNEAF